ncbi:uncharacterized protein LOC143190423 isoform X3 [Rhynchophorus ferrugineus]|uniref:uncharacterized protein LOC143190423 isoform X3 n=1 Tax=Rhynchophorus ferrugineus TaxID=354439 RepID=UPI003FCDBF5D
MSSEFTDVARIQDEEVLRRMWQETDDFGRKKEIRAHMYKVRENRLKEFYNTGEVSSEIQKTTTTTTRSSSDTSSKANMSTTYADDLADQTYVKLKSKEVRDSESPIRDNYNKSIDKRQDQGWTVTSSNQRSDDGKTFSTTHSATRSGTENINGGKLDYSAKLEEKSSVFQDGDDKNFTKAVGSSSSSVIRQEATGGDENSAFKSSTTKTSSSSKYVSESRNTNTTEDIRALPSTNVVVTNEKVPYVINEDNIRSITEKTFTTDAPSDLKKHPNYIEGKTKITQETKTLADGTVVTTTHYVTKDGNSTSTATHKKYSNIGSTKTERRSSSSTAQTHTRNSVINDTKRSTTRDDRRPVEYIIEPGKTVDIKVKTVKEYGDHTDNTDVNERYSNQHTTKIIRESIQTRKNDTNLQDTRKVDNKTIDIITVPADSTTTTIKTTRTIITEEIPREQTDVTYHTTKTHQINQKKDIVDRKKVVNDEFITTERQQEINTRDITETKNNFNDQPQRKPHPMQEPCQSSVQPKSSQDIPYEQPQRKSQPNQEPYEVPLQPKSTQGTPYGQPQRVTQPIEEPCHTPVQPQGSPKTPYEQPQEKQQPNQEPYQVPVQRKIPNDVPYEQPERRQPIKPGKSEIEKPQPTEGQYETTYRTEYTSKRISVDVSPTHDAFARSLRSVTPERNTRSGRNTPRTGSNTSLRSSPEKMRFPSRTSPDRGRSTSPKKPNDKCSSTETITYKTTKTSKYSPEGKHPTGRKPTNDSTKKPKTTEHYSTDTITRRSRTETTTTDSTDTNTLTRSKNKPRSPSPTSTTTSDFEYVRNDTDDSISITTTTSTTNKKITDTARPDSLDITRKTKKVTDRSPTSPLTDLKKSPTKQSTPTSEKPKTTRTDTYEERVKEILGLKQDKQEIRRSSLERNSLKKTSVKEVSTRTYSDDVVNRLYVTKTPSTPKLTDKKSPERKSPEKYPDSIQTKKTSSQIRKSPQKEPLEQSPERKSPRKSGPAVSEFPSQVRRSPEREPLEPYPEKRSPTKSGPSVGEFPSQIRKSPQREPLEPYPEKKSPTKSSPTVSEFPSQVRRSPEREPLEPYPEKISPTKSKPTVSEFPSQVRRSPEREPVEPYPNKRSPTKCGPTANEFPSQFRKSPEKEPLEPYPGKKSPTKSGPSVNEFPSQIRKSPQREPLEPYPEKKSPTKSGPTVSEFPSQVRRSPEREPLEPYPEKKSPTKSGPSINEFPSQIRKSPQREPLEPYPEKKSPTKSGPTVSEFPSQVRRSPEREPLEPYPEKKSPTKLGPSVNEYPSQIRKSPQREPLEPYPEKKSPTKFGPTVNEFPSQVRRSPEREPLEIYPEKKSPTKSAPTVSEFPSQVRKSPEREPLEPYPEKKSPTKSGPSLNEFPSQIRKSPQREPLEPYPEKKSPTKSRPTVSEFPSQVRRSTEREPLETYPDKKSATKCGPTVSEFPSQVRRSPEREPIEPYPEKGAPTKSGPSVNEFPSQIRKSPQREPLEPYPENKSPKRAGSTVSEFPSQVRSSPEREPLEPYPDRKSPEKYKPGIDEFPSQTKRSHEKEPLEPYPERKSPTKSKPSVDEFPSQIRRSPEKEPLEPYPERKSPTKYKPSVNEFPSQIRKSPEREPLEPYPEKKSPKKSAPTVDEFPSQIKRSPEREPLEPYPEKKSPTKSGPKVSEFPSQSRKLPEKEPLDKYPGKKSPVKSGPNVSEYPSQVRKTPQKKTVEPYPEKKTPTKSIPSSIVEYSKQVKRVPEKQPLETYLEKKSPVKSRPGVSEYPSQVKKAPRREPVETNPERKTSSKYDRTVIDISSQEYIKNKKITQKVQPIPGKKQPKSPKKIKKEKTTSDDETSEDEQEQIEEISEITENYDEDYQRRTTDEIYKHDQIITTDKKRSTKEILEIERNINDKSRKPSSKIPEGKRATKPRDVPSTDDEIYETITEKHLNMIETRKPVEEPVAERKIFSQLCREDEITRVDKKRTTQELLESEIVEHTRTVQPKERSPTRASPERIVGKDLFSVKIDKKPIKKSQKPRTKSESSTSDEDVHTLEENVIVEISDIKNENIKKVQKTNKNAANTVESKTITTLRKDKTAPKDKKPSTKTTTEIIKTTVTKKDSPIDKPTMRKPTQTSVKKVTETVSTTTKLVKKPTPKTVYSPQAVKKQPETIYRVEKTKFIGESEYQDQFSKVNKVRKEPIRKTTKPVKTTLHDIEKENLREDKTLHIRTNRVDDTVTKKKVTKTIMVNGNVPKTKITEVPSKLSTKKSPISYKTTETKPKTPTTTKYSTTVRKTVTDTRTTKPTVTTTITVTPKTKPSTKTPQSKTPSKKPKRKPTNGYASSDTEDDSLVESVEGSFTEFRQDKNEFSRTTDETFTKRIREQLPREHVITTKTVLINNDDITDREIIVNLQRSKSSREPTPDRLCPRPLTSDEEEESSPVRYPDEISEPDDGSLRRKPKKLSDMPIFESPDTQEFTRITEITDNRKKITEVDRVEETDESLLSIDKKINKFMDTADKLTKEPIKPKPTSADKSKVFKISDDLLDRSDECLLSVSDKVSKFITTAEQLTSQKLPEKSKTPKTNVSIQRKVEEFETSVEEANKPKKPTGRAPKVERPDLTQIDDELKEDECLLSVSDKVSKFITTAEHLTNTVSKPISLSKIDIKPRQDEPREVDRRSPNRDVQYERQQTYTRKSTSLSPEREMSPSPRQRSPLYTRPSLIPRHTPDRTTGITETQITETTHVIEDKSVPSPRRSPTTDDNKTILSTTSRLRNTESIKKAKALFENIAKDQTKPKQRDILSRPSVFEGKTTKRTDETRTSVQTEDREEISRRSSIKSNRIQNDKDLRSAKLVEEITRRSQSPQKSPERSIVDNDRHRSPEKIEITRFRPSSPEKIPEIVTYTPRSREPSPDGDIPHYMKPLDRSLRPNSPHRDSITQLKIQPQDSTDSKPSRFGVTLKRTDSDKVSKTNDSSSIERRRISVDKKITEEEVDEIFDLEILEELLEIVVSYEIRRKIRTQIRLVKRLITEGTLETYISKRRSVVRRGSSPVKSVRPDEPRRSSPEKLYEYTDTVDRRRSSVEHSEYQSSYSKSERRYSSESTNVIRKSPSPVRDRSSPQRLSPERKVTKTVDVNPTGKVTTTKTTESIPGGVRVTTTTTTETKSFTTLKKTVPGSKKPVEDNQPEWVKQRNLRNTKETNTKKVTSGTSTVTKKTSSRSSPSKEVKPTDIITSSYGVGPTDENGTPLFGLKALRAQNKNTTTKVQGTVVSSEYYSENGQEPVGQISVTKYSTDPRDLEEEGMITTDGEVTSVTTTQKFGYKDTPSLKNLTGSKKTKEICDKNESTTTKTTKVNRRGSVKAISQKFIENAVETLKSERQTTYPKAGLILRTSSFKSTEDPHSREGSPGSQVLLSGMEAHARSTKSQTTESSSPSGTVKRSTKITSTITEGGKPRTTTRVFQRPVTEKDLETVWDEQTLKLLLEQSTDYEERRVIRARLRQVMAEQEACTALVDQATKGEDPATPTTPTAGQLEGESQLLPLLKGLLDAPENDITPDSGTESGEDQRSNLIAEVQTALEKLSTSLLNDQTDISEERRSNLLQLVAKLQAGLSGNDRRSSTSSSGGRFQKRKTKQSRHTVGVSKEELADARKLIEEISLNELNTSASGSKVNLSKQNSESSVPTSSASSSYRSIHQAKVKNATARPFSSSNSTTSSVQTPTEHFDGFDNLFGEDKDKDITYHEAPTVQQKATPNFSTTVKQSSQTRLDRGISNDSTGSIKSAFKAVQQAAASKVSAMKQDQKDESESEEVEEEEVEEEEEDDSSTVKTSNTVENAPLTSNPIYSRPVQKYDEKCSRFDTQKRLKMKRANTIDIPKPLNFYQDDDDSDSDHEDGNQKRRDSSYTLKGPVGVGDPNTKKIVPVFQPKTESDKKFLAFINKHNDNNSNKNSPWARNSSVWGSKFGNIKSTFEKTQDNDAKSFWKSADDNIRRTTSNQFGPKISRESARNLQQMFEEKRKESQKNPAPVYSAGPVHQSNIVTGSLQVKTEKEKQYKVIPQPLPVNQFSHAPQSAFKPIKKVPQPPVPNRSSIVFSPENRELIKSEIKEPTGPAFLYSPKPLTSPIEKTTVTSPVASKPWAASSTGSRVISLAASRFEQPPIKEPPRPRKMSRESNKALVSSYQANTNIVDRTPAYINKSSENKPSSVRKHSGQYENLESKSAEAQQKPQTYQIRTSVVESQYTPQVKLPPQNIPLSPQQFTPSHQQNIPFSLQQNIPLMPPQNTQYPLQNPQIPPQNIAPQNYSVRYDQPQTYSIRYDQPQTQYYPPQNYSIRYDQPQNYSIRYDQQSQQNLPQNYNIAYNQPQTSPNQNYQPQNYRIVYDRPQNLPQNYSVKYDQPQSALQSPQTPTRPQSYSSPHDSVSQVQNKVSPSSPAHNTQVLSPTESSPQPNNEYTSTFVFKPTQNQKVPVQAIEPVVQPPKAERQISNESLHEHSAVSSRVMTGPVSQQAVTVKQKSPMSRDQHDMEAALNLKSSLQKLTKQDSKEGNIPNKNRSPARSPSNSFSYKPRPPEVKSPSLSQSFKYKSEIQSKETSTYKPSDCPKPTVSPSSFKSKSTFEDITKETKNCGVVKPMQQKPIPIYNNTNISKSNEKIRINDKGQSVVTGQFHIPVISVKSPESPRPPTQTQVLSKSDSWHQICLAHQSTNEKPVPKPGPVKSKSSHSLAVPKMYEAGMSKEEMLHKRKTMEAFLTGNKSPPADTKIKAVKRSINRIKTSEKRSTQTKVTGGLCRSRTLPDIICPDLLDESNVDKAFDELFESS